MMAKQDYYCVYVITDCVMREVKDNESKKEIVKISALPNGQIPDDFVPFAKAFFMGHTDFEDMICEKIYGDEKEVTITGLTSLGMITLPFDETLAVGDDFTAPDIVEFENPSKQGYATIEQLIYAKNEEDTEPLMNWAKGMETVMGGPIKMAETDMALMNAEEETEFFGAEYDQHMMNLYHSLYRSEREYEANV